MQSFKDRVSNAVRTWVAKRFLRTTAEPPWRGSPQRQQSALHIRFSTVCRADLSSNQGNSLMAIIHQHHVSLVHSASFATHAPVVAHWHPANPYAGLSDAALVREFDKNFDAFRPAGSPHATLGKIREVARRPLTGDAQQNKLTMLAREVLKRDQVMNQLDTVDVAGRDGIIGRWNPKMAAAKLSDVPPQCSASTPEAWRPSPIIAASLIVY